MVITLDYYKCPSWNILYSGRHWGRRQEMAKYAHQSVMEALQKVKWTTYTSKVVIYIEAHLKRIIDVDNVSAKLIIDGLKLEGLIEDDSPKYVHSLIVTVVKDKKDYTVVEIKEYE